jgi:two-component system CheB/CheR fusion protein
MTASTTGTPQAPAVAPTDVVDAVATTVAAHPVVGMGASAGGLEAFEAFFRACPANTGAAFVLVPHLDPSHTSLLAEILQRCTAMPVLEAQDQMATAPDHIYVIPPNRDMALLGRVLQLSAPEQPRGHRMPIDAFLRSLADDLGDRAIGVVLSGTATDGTLGLRAIRGAGGVCMVQEPASAKYDGMPQSAINAGYATHILPVQDMPAMLQEVLRLAPYRQSVAAVVPEQTQAGINKVLLQLRAATGHDFSQYKKSTVGRRIHRRMELHAIDDEAVYARFLQHHPEEAPLLFKELLINVTSFFRDPAAFVALKQLVLPPLLAALPAGQAFRVWVAGCASGEEAYSIAIVLRELQEEARAQGLPDFAVQIYASDLDDDAIALARSGRYPPNVAQDIAPERLARHFVQDDAGYKIKKDVRDMVVFAVQGLLKDPPFSRLDLLSCRNVMIYLEPDAQDRLLARFSQAIKPGGVLFLSPSESITGRAEWFAPLDRKNKFYQARPSARQALAGPSPPSTTAATPRWAGHAAEGAPVGLQRPPKPSQVAEISHRVLLHSYAPASVTTSAEGNILYVHGDISRYLTPAPGPMSSHVVEMARAGLQGTLRSALLSATAPTALDTPAVAGPAWVETPRGGCWVRVSVRRMPGPGAGQSLLLVSFEELPAQALADLAEMAGMADMAGMAGMADGADMPGPTATAAGATHANANDATAADAARPTRPAGRPAHAARVHELERELAYARQNQQVADEEQQAAHEELKSANEELQSTNEELQSANEELETSKEELQSLNEETVTVNAELCARIDQFTRLQNDMKNLLDSVGTGTLFLDHGLVIRRFTPAAAKVYRLIAGDVGRPLSDIRANLADAGLSASLGADLQTVLDTLVPIEREVRTTGGAWYLARMQPYRTFDNVIEGVVLTFTDVTEFKLALQAAHNASAEAAAAHLQATQLARDLAQGIVDTVAEPMLVLDGSLRVVSASRHFYDYFQVAAAQTVGRKVYALGDGQWDIAALRQLLERVLPRNEALTGYVVEHNFVGLGPRRLVLNARRIVTAQGNTELILLAMVAIEEGHPS